MKNKIYFKDDESGAVTVDWVVLTSAIVGIGMAVIILISGGISNATSNISSGIGTKWNFNFTVKSAQDYFDFGIEAYPFDQRQAWLTARQQVDADAPDGYEFDPNLTTTRFVENSTNVPIYVSDDGLSYSIGGEIVVAVEYDVADSTAFKIVFDEYWEQSQ